jgi:hypothetical protein
MIGKRNIFRKLFLACLILFIITIAYGWQDFKSGWESYNCQCDHNQETPVNTSEH